MAPSAIAAAWDQIDARKADDTATPPFDTDPARWWRQMLGSCCLRMYRKWPCYCGVAKKADEVPRPIGIYFLAEIHLVKGVAWSSSESYGPSRSNSGLMSLRV